MMICSNKAYFTDTLNTRVCSLHSDGFLALKVSGRLISEAVMSEKVSNTEFSQQLITSLVSHLEYPAISAKNISQP